MSAAAYGNVRLPECKNTEFVWELKRGFKQGGRKESCPLTRVSVKRASTVSEILRQILSRTYTGLQLNVDKTLLGLFTSFVGRREFALSVVETTCLEETLFKVVRACMRKTVLRMIL